MTMHVTSYTMRSSAMSNTCETVRTRSRAVQPMSTGFIRSEGRYLLIKGRSVSMVTRS